MGARGGFEGCGLGGMPGLGFRLSGGLAGFDGVNPILDQGSGLTGRRAGELARFI
jgi:hypothetical protein